ncbi:MAG: insulinase family protein [Candidatus Eremiobacteraeota bacterium]|nr:insulinase family protein [Candidatus Eremiobacteraeota bacterium]
MRTELLEGPGGSRLVIQEDHSHPLVTVTAAYQGGQRWECAQDQGMTSLTQRLLIKGTSRRSRDQLADDLEFLGAPFLPYCGKDTYGATLAVLSRHFRAGLAIMAECLGEPAFAQEEVEKEKSLLELERRRLADDSLKFALEEVEKLLYDGHPYSLSSLGTLESLAAVSTGQLAGWHRRLFDRSRLTLAVVKDISPEAVKAQVDELFTWDGSPPPGLAASSCHPPDRDREQVVCRERKQATLALALLGPRFTAPDYAAFQVVQMVLAGMGGRLFAELRDRRGLGYLVNSSLERRLDGSCFKAYVGTSEARAEEALEAMRAEIGRLAAEPVGLEELYRAKRYMLGLHEINLQKKAYLAHQLATYEALGLGYQAFERFPEQVRAVTIEQVQQVAAQYLCRPGALVRVLPAGQSGC